MKSVASLSASPWPHRFALLLAGTTFPLIWVGGLVTTYDAGMAVPDWPNTYGYNMFLYPWQTWIAGPWDLFIEHGHRLLGTLAGALTIALVWAVLQTDQRRWLRQLAWATLAAILGQGCLGGARVLLQARSLALVHGCTGPAFFGLCVALCVFTSAWWRAPASAEPRPGLRTFSWLALTHAISAFVQLVLGAVLRHMPVDAAPGIFRWTVYFHLGFAALVTFHIGWLTWYVLRRRIASPALRRPVFGLDLLIICQLLLGTATWTVNYWWPTWALDLGMAARYTTIEAKGWVQSTIATAHAATGSLILGAAVLLLVRARRLRGWTAAQAPDAVRREGTVA